MFDKTEYLNRTKNYNKDDYDKEIWGSDLIQITAYHEKKTLKLYFVLILIRTAFY